MNLALVPVENPDSNQDAFHQDTLKLIFTGSLTASDGDVLAVIVAEIIRTVDHIDVEDIGNGNGSSTRAEWTFTTGTDNQG
jgi:hypothetical protein